MGEPLISIRDLRYRYAGAAQDVLRIPSLDVGGSGLIAITGPSGAGKTTLVELLAGTLHEPYEGTVQVLGTDWKELRRDADRQRQLRRIGLIPQDFGLLPSWTPRRTLEQDLADAQVPVEQRDARVRESLAQVGLVDFSERGIGALSGGQRQRVAIARMLARDVELVIADEPTANLDPDLVTEIGGLLKELAQKVPVIVVTHDPRMAEMCDRTIVLQAAVQANDGRHGTAGSAPTIERRRHRALLVGTIAVAAIAVAGGLLAGYHASGRGGKPKSSSSGPAAAAPAPSPTPSASPTAYRLVRITLPVQTLPTSQGVNGPEPLYPNEVSAEIPQPWKQDVSAYGLAGVVLLAPAGWYGSGGTGADASSGCSLHAGGASAIPGKLTYQSEATGAGGYASADAAAYFPWVRKDMSTWAPGMPLPAPRAGLSEHLEGKDLVWYTVTNASAITRRMQITGVAQASDSGEFSFDRLEVALPADDGSLAKAILDWYISPGFATTQGVCFTFQQYFEGIGSQDYQQAWQEFSPRFQRQTPLSQWSAGMSTVIDSNITIHWIKLINSRTAVAYVTFSSFQDASQGPNGDTQDNWTLDYRMVRSGWQWLIDYAGSHNGSTHTPG